MQNFNNIQRDVTGGICTLTFDKPNSAANIFDQETFDELNAHLAFLEGEGRTLRGVVFRSAKPKIFIAGADLIGFSKESELTQEKLSRLIDQGQGTFERIARLPFPSVAAIHGVCLGGGFELALACDWRVASNASVTKVGLPEVLLGILPAWGGSTRLPRLIGLPAALGAILTGKQYAAKPAQKLGLVDDVVFPEGLAAAAGKRIAAGRRPAPKSFLANKSLVASVVASQAKKKALAKTRGNYPAPLKALEVAANGLGVPHDVSLRNEKAAFIELAKSEASRNLMRVFLLQERAKKLPLPADVSAPDGKPRPVKKAVVIGAGVMGAGIAQWLAARGIPVRLKDVGPEALAKGMQSIAKIFRDATKRRVFTPTEAMTAQDRIVPVYRDDVPMRDADLVIEAAVEKLDLKRKIFADLEKKVGPETVLATNTSALSIDQVAEGLERPERVVGIHYFNPVHRMQLVEIVRGARTSAETLAIALAFVKATGKLPVIAKDSPGFLVNRVLLPYMVEAVRLVLAGYEVETIDRIMLDFGMPMGPLRLTDEVGLDVANHVAKDLAARLPHFAAATPQDDVLERMMAKGWLGRKSGMGFYDFSGGKKSGDDAGSPVNPDVRLMLLSTEPAPPAKPDEALLRDRLVLIMVNEAARVLEEGVVGAPEDVDFGMIMGTGWAPFRGGPLRYADHRGLAEISRRLAALAPQAGSHFQPCGLIRELADRNGTFYGRSPA